MHRSVDADYYGYRDEEDGVLAPLEAAAEQKGADRRWRARSFVFVHVLTPPHTMGRPVRTRL